MGIAVIPAPAGGALKEYTQEFNSSGNWVAPDNTNSVDIFIVGGGGGGGGKAVAVAGGAGGGGGGGAVIWRNVSVTPGTTYAVTIGGGGAGGTTAGNSGSSGSATTFGNIVNALGGGGGGGAIGTNANPVNLPNSSGTIGGSAGWINLGNQTWSAGGSGAGGAVVHPGMDTIAPNTNADQNALTAPNQGGGYSGVPTYNFTNFLGSNYINPSGGPGFMGYGWGASGSLLQTGPSRFVMGFGAGSGSGWSFNGVYNAPNAGAANRGGGGGGGGRDSNFNNNATNGAAGGSGYCRIKYLA